MNYSPGPVSTEMQNQIAAESWCESTKDWSRSKLAECQVNFATDEFFLFQKLSMNQR